MKSVAAIDGAATVRSATPLISVTPAHNEAAALPLVIGCLVSVLHYYRTEIIVVDDGSSDGTWSVIEGLRASYPQVRAVRLTRNFGHQAAILAGLNAAKGDAVTMMDSDGQHPSALIPQLIERWQEGYQIVQAVRAGSPDEAFLKRITSRRFYRILRTHSGVDVPPGSADFRLRRRPGVTVVLQSTGPLVFLRGLIPWLGFRTCYVEFLAERRVAGEPSYTWRPMLQFSVDGMISFSIGVAPLSRRGGVLGIHAA